MKARAARRSDGCSRSSTSSGRRCSSDCWCIGSQPGDSHEAAPTRAARRRVRIISPTPTSSVLISGARRPQAWSRSARRKAGSETSPFSSRGGSGRREGPVRDRRTPGSWRATAGQQLDFDCFRARWEAQRCDYTRTLIWKHGQGPVGGGRQRECQRNRPRSLVAVGQRCGEGVTARRGG